MLYCSQVWWGFASKQELDSLSALVRKLVRLGFLPKSFPTFEELCKKADIDLFRNILTNTSHTLHDLLPLSTVLVMTCAHAHITVFSLDLIGNRAIRRRTIRRGQFVADSSSRTIRHRPNNDIITAYNIRRARLKSSRYLFPKHAQLGT